MNDPAAYFNDPLDPARSLQLNNRYWHGERFEHLDMLREADEDINRRRFTRARRSLRRVKALLPPLMHRRFVSRLVYSIVYRTVFEPIRFSIKLSPKFVEANAYRGSEPIFSKEATCTEELSDIAELARSVFRDRYGRDLMTSSFGIRYQNSTYQPSRERMTRFGSFSDFHLDEGKDFTCIIYLCEVTEANGCFTYIDGTNTVAKSHVLRALHQVVNMDMALKSPEDTAALPLELRGGMSIGDYLDDDKRERLQPHVVPFVGRVGDGIIFNGFDTLHRGGKPLSGERLALFISTTGRLRTHLKKAACDAMAALWL
jgi:hypothetical protein